MPWGRQQAFKTPMARQRPNAGLSAFPPPVRIAGKPQALAPIEDMVRQARKRRECDTIGSLAAGIVYCALIIRMRWHSFS